MMMRRVAAALVPPWLEPLLTTPFFSTCSSHSDAARSERNMYCLDCSGTAFCFYCRSESHSGHRVIQIRRSSYHDVVRVAEVQKSLDISGVQTYVINSARVLFLNERPQPRGGAKGVASPHACEICSRSLLDPFRFCSLGCKLVGIKRNGDASFVLKEEEEEEASGSGGAGVGEEGEGGGVEGKVKDKERRAEGTPDRGRAHDIRLSTPSPPNSRRRKGVPHRSPLTS
ncbi:uncharacterized protein LOC120266671 isoform X1 [Dioscorea cayenensis subsp. rotundata]|uniref:Uncharacterized protein LOC120266671 isoform X1 n=1 Tax=Dioscorea cayennensis subsp. rotundata TaxID=55577 RepID=A0AB40BS28_DIOCR|nr:uncharacterized protein LOC120266671 isoform X1 [Dioscorea cayenensis subsp. rotundata]